MDSAGELRVDSTAELPPSFERTAPRIMAEYSEISAPVVSSTGARQAIDRRPAEARDSEKILPTTRELDPEPANARVQEVTAELREPPLMPREESRAIFSSPQPGRDQRRTSRDASTFSPRPQATEINITIGRVEVTAVQGPAPAKRAPSPRKPGSSLDEYLAARDRGRS